MSDCCNSSSDNTVTNKALTRKACPSCKEIGLSVQYATVLQHVKQPWGKRRDNQGYFFCHSTDCDVVYFSENDTKISKAEVRNLIGIKEIENDDALLCYCFDISRKDYRKKPNLKAYVVGLTKDKICSCDTKNPSGRCCLRDF